MPHVTVEVSANHPICIISIIKVIELWLHISQLLPHWFAIYGNPRHPGVVPHFLWMQLSCRSAAWNGVHLREGAFWKWNINYKLCDKDKMCTNYWWHKHWPSALHHRSGKRRHCRWYYTLCSALVWIVEEECRRRSRRNLPGHQHSDDPCTSRYILQGCWFLRCLWLRQE